MVPLTWYLIVAAGLFCIGAFGAAGPAERGRRPHGRRADAQCGQHQSDRLLALRRGSRRQRQLTGQLFAIFVITVAAAEAAVGLALIIAIYRQRSTVNVEEIDTMKG